MPFSPQNKYVLSYYSPCIPILKEKSLSIILNWSLTLCDFLKIFEIQTQSASVVSSIFELGSYLTFASQPGLA